MLIGISIHRRLGCVMIWFLCHKDDHDIQISGSGWSSG